MLLAVRIRGKSARFVHPLDPPPRTAILVPGFQSTRKIRVFPQGWDQCVERFSPAAVAGTFDQLIALGKLQFRVTHTVICLSWHLDGLLSAGQRDQLWNLFGVPVFEQYLGANNVLLAYECEAHTGLHTTPAYKGPSITGHCQCKDGVRACFLPRFALAASASG